MNTFTTLFLPRTFPDWAKIQNVSILMSRRATNLESTLDYLYIFIETAAFGPIIITGASIGLVSTKHTIASLPR